MANTRIPARAARWEVEATVVAAEPPRATHRREVAHARLHEALAERQRLQRGVVQADPRLAVDHRDRGRDGALGAHRGLELAGHLEVAPARQPVGDQGALEGHHGTAVRRAPRRRRRRCASRAILGSRPRMGRCSRALQALRWRRVGRERYRRGPVRTSNTPAGDDPDRRPGRPARGRPGRGRRGDGRGRLAAVEPVLLAARPGHPRRVPRRAHGPACTSARPSSPPPPPWRCSGRRPRR